MDGYEGKRLGGEESKLNGGAEVEMGKEGKRWIAKRVGGMEC